VFAYAEIFIDWYWLTQNSLPRFGRCQTTFQLGTQ
jgi:hypothetical protein